MMPSMACFWSSEKDCAEAAGASSTVAASSDTNSAGRSNGKSLLGPGGKLPRRLVVAAGEGGLRRREIGVGQIALVAIGHRQLQIGVGRLGLLGQRRTQQRDGFLDLFGVVA